MILPDAMAEARRSYSLGPAIGSPVGGRSLMSRGFRCFFELLLRSWLNGQT